MSDQGLQALPQPAVTGIALGKQTQQPPKPAPPWGNSLFLSLSLKTWIREAVPSLGLPSLPPSLHPQPHQLPPLATITTTLRSSYTNISSLLPPPAWPLPLTSPGK